MGKKRSDEILIGEDSFLDTCANLVGILIIFVVIAGARAKTNSETIIENSKSIEEELSGPIAAAQRVQSDLDRQTQELQKYAIETEYRRQERNQLLDRVNLLKSEMDERIGSLGQIEQIDITQLTEQKDLEQRLKETVRDQGLIDAAAQQIVALEHLPTPMAKTVFSEEIHIMLKHGQVTMIPWERLVESLKKNASLEVRRNNHKESIDSQLGPIEGFLMHYRFIAKQGMVSNGQSTALAQMVELDRFELEPTDQIVRESLDKALSNNGRLRLELAGRTPQRTVITVWTYPDSFGDFRRLKEALFAEGYLSAARPLPDDVRIGASPHGSNTMAQ